MKYCGGCNPRFDRVAFVRRLEKAFPQVAFAPFRPGEPCELAVIVCGCPSRCAAAPEITGRRGAGVICAEDAFDSLCERITGVLGARQEEETI